MTGFGSATFDVEGVAFEAEIRTLNARHLEVRVRLPRPLAAGEPEVRALVGERLMRGQVDVVVRATTETALTDTVSLDLAAAERYLRAARELAERYGVPGAVDLATLVSLPGVARSTDRSLPGEALRQALRRSLASALDAVVAVRAAEGAALARELEARLGRVLELAEGVEERADAVQATARERLRKRAQDLQRETGLLDEARLHQEVVLAAGRLDVTEEVVRLRSHVEAFRTALRGRGPSHPQGRRLEFLLQEMGREANTIASKGADAPIAHLVVELKTELGRLREQVQNVE
jgi:uncharacterized protein (TIGR00255 family)